MITLPITEYQFFIIVWMTLSVLTTVSLIHGVLLQDVLITIPSLVGTFAAYVIGAVIYFSDKHDKGELRFKGE